MRKNTAAACILISVLLAGQTAAAAEGPVEFVPPSAGTEETVLTIMWDSAYSDPQTQDPLYRWAEASFEGWEDKEGVTLELIPNAWTKGGECPDVIVGDTNSLEQDAESGILSDLSLDVSEYGEWSWYYEAVQDMASFGNGIYGVPFEARTAGLWYNQEAFAQAGVISYNEEENRYEAWEPENRKEILEACQALRKADREAECLDAADPLFYGLVLRGAGGRIATQEGNWVVESDYIGTVLDFVRDLGKQGASGGELIVPAFSVPEGMEDAGFAAMPAEQEGSGAVSFAAGKLFEIPAGSADRDLAWSFICRMMSKENYSAYMESVAKEGGLCVRRDVREIGGIAENEENELRQSLLAGAGVWHGPGKYIAAEECIREMLQTVLDNPTDAGVKEAKESYAESMREAYGAAACRPLVEAEEEEEEKEQ